jgi:hypothetical protein
MFKTSIAYAVILVAGLAPAAAWSADDDGQYFVKGLGTRTCQQYLDETAAGSSMHVLYRSWLNGYLTAYNALVPTTYDIAPGSSVEGLARATESLCRQAPDALFATVAQALTTALLPRRQVAMAAAEGTAEPNMAGVQRALRERGYFDGDIDGLLGPETGTAIEAFQRDQGLDATGLPDAETLQALSQ